MSSEDKKEKEYKIALIGESAVGKTSLLCRYLNNTHNFDIPSTFSANFATKKIKKEDGKEIKLQIWDTAGQEQHRSLTKLYFKNAAGIIIVYDITRKDSFEEIKNFWYPEVKKEAPSEVKLAIVGNKFDLYENEKVSKEEGEAFAESIGALFKLTSALDSIGVDDLFTDMSNALTDNEPKLNNNKDNIKLSKAKKTKKKKKKCC